MRAGGIVELQEVFFERQVHFERGLQAIKGSLQLPHWQGRQACADDEGHQRVEVGEDGPPAQARRPARHHVRAAERVHHDAVLRCVGPDVGFHHVPRQGGQESPQDAGRYLLRGDEGLDLFHGLLPSPC